ncbi:MAG: hypothetical protein A2W93_10055 [Bacteroidetes bacterium GWF2_43_63]|nr:MAG: hypothetical protein A2W94_02415 [Bacteroidetes bacterium GWE2_42_42]OFY52866.1 MAG: hypothetical protein A2W93_10055 [Bacteroidetes bacterium GWF2_43_63]HBG70071.1 hypothetical protein [Bacteroidales bacterium]HCB62322.1 hypothetical protein [Bacteroidales bacterium]
METTAKLKKIFPIVTGQGKNGTWKKQELLFEIGGQYPKSLFGAIWGDKVDTTLLKEGNTLRLFFDIESREFNGRWYTDVKIWKLEPETGSTSSPLQDSPPVSDVAPDDLGYDPMDPLPF